jgi:hypothetical protein
VRLPQLSSRFDNAAGHYRNKLLCFATNPRGQSIPGCGFRRPYRILVAMPDRVAWSPSGPAFIVLEACAGTTQDYSPIVPRAEPSTATLRRPMADQDI